MTYSNIIFSDDEQYYGIFVDHRTIKTYVSIKLLFDKNKRDSLVQIAKHIKFKYSENISVQNSLGNVTCGIEYCGAFQEIKLFSQSEINSSQIIINVTDVVQLANIILSHLD